MSLRRLSRPLLIGMPLIAALLLVILGAGSGVDWLRGQGVLPPVEDTSTDGISVALPAGGDAGSTTGSSAGPATGASGGGMSPGPDGVGAVQAPGSGTPGDPTAVPDSEPGRPGVIRIPNLRIAMGSIVAHAGGSDASFIYRAAIEARDAADYLRAVELFDVVAESGGVLAPLAMLRAAQSMATSEANVTPGAAGVTGAADRFATLVAPGGPAERLPADVEAVALIEGAVAFERAGWVEDALAALDRVEALPVSTDIRAQAAWEQSRLLEDLGDPAWQALAIRAMELAPGSAASQSAMDLLDERDAAYPALTGAHVAYRSFRNLDATTRYESLLDAGSLSDSEAAIAWFYLGALQERAWEGEDAIDAYAMSIDADPGGIRAPDARYWRGRVLEELGRPIEAAVEYDLLVGEHPGSRFVEDARLRAAVALGIGGDGADATERLAAITRTGSPNVAAEAAHWHAVLVSLFDAPSASIAPAGSYDPLSYAAAFEQSGLAVTAPFPSAALAELAEEIAVDQTEIEVWLADAGRTRDAPSAVLQDVDVRLAWTLAGAGEPAVARGLLQRTINDRRGQSYELLALALEARRHGLYDVSMRSAQAILAPFAPVEQLGAPRGLLGLAYPVPYLPQATAAAEEFGVPVLLLYALMRQESAFHPEAGSSAGAFGLTQVIPATGEYIADALGVSGWRFADLAVPDVATRFGAYYLALQLDEFEGHMLAALAAYNGGPGNAARWLRSQQFAGPDGYLYAVDFTETRSYLELVSSNYAIYRFVYLGLEVPRLPHQ